MKQINYIDISISIYNQEKIIKKVLNGILKNTTTPFHLIILFDGCTDKTETIAINLIQKFLRQNPNGLLKKITTKRSPNVYETKANNITFKLAESEHLITLQDDMIIDEIGWEKRLIFPLTKFNDVFAVTSRGAQDIKYNEAKKELYENTADRSLGLPREIFAVRDIINRGPVAFKVNCLKKLNYLNENYAPCNLDEADLCLRAWRDFGWKCGAFWINYLSRDAWSKTQSKDSTMPVEKSNSKNILKIFNDHNEYLKSNIKHSADYIITDEEIFSFSIQKSKNFLYKPCSYIKIKFLPYIEEIVFFLFKIKNQIIKKEASNSFLITKHIFAYEHGVINAKQLSNGLFKITNHKYK